LRASAMPRKDAGEPLMRLVLAQPHELICDALAQMLQAAGFEVVGQCARSDELQACLRTLGPDLAVVDAELATHGNVGDLLRAACRGLAGGRLVLLASEVEPGLARQTLELEVDGVVLKCAASNDVVGALRRVAAGDAVYPAGCIAAARRTGSSLLDQLSPRQVEVLELIASGATNAEIAAALVIAPKTVDHHVSAVLAKLGVASRQEAAAAAHRLGVDGAEGREPGVPR